MNSHAQKLSNTHLKVVLQPFLVGGFKLLTYLGWYFQIHWNKLRKAHPYTGGIEVIIGISKARLRCLGTTQGVFTPFLVLDTEIVWRIRMLRILIPAASTNAYISCNHT